VGDCEVDGSSRGVFGCFLDARADPDEMNCPALSDDRPLERLDPAPLAGVLLIEITPVCAGVGRFVAIGRQCRDRAEIGVEG
jgi:hypothetical protein